VPRKGSTVSPKPTRASRSGSKLQSMAMATSVTALLFVVGCVRTVPLREGLQRLRGVDPAQSSQRKLVELDVSGDGVLDSADAAFFAALAGHAVIELNKRHESIEPLHGLYQGPQEGSVFELLAAGETVDLTGLETSRLREIAIEARWMGMQVRMAELQPGILDDRLFGGVLLSTIPSYNPDTMAGTAACTGVDEIDLDAIRKAGITPTAVMDLDSTVWDGNVMDPFLAGLAESDGLTEQGNTELRIYLKTLPEVDAAAVDAASVKENAALLLQRWTSPDVPEELRPSAKDMFYNIVTMMNGMTVTDAQKVARQVYEKGAGPFGPWKLRTFANKGGCGMRDIIARMEDRGIEVYLLSATLDVLAVEGAKGYSIPEARALGSVLEVVDGKYTGKVKDSAYYAKGAITRQWLPAPPLVAFGDSPSSDFTMLQESAGLGFLVNPREKLLAQDQNDAGGRLVALPFDGTEADIGGE